MKKVLPVIGHPEDIAKLQACIGMLFPGGEIEVVSGPRLRHVFMTSTGKRAWPATHERRTGHTLRMDAD